MMFFVTKKELAELRAEVAANWKLAMSSIRAMEGDVLAYGLKNPALLATEFYELRDRVQQLAEEIQKLKMSELPSPRVIFDSSRPLHVKAFTEKTKKRKYKHTAAYHLKRKLRMDKFLRETK